jgi:hypothetical protein
MKWFYKRGQLTERAIVDGAGAVAAFAAEVQSSRPGNET